MSCMTDPPPWEEPLVFRTYTLTLTTWSDVIDIRGRMSVGDLNESGDPQPGTRKLWTPGDLDARITGCSHANALTMAEYIEGAGHIFCCSSRQAWDELTVYMSPCTTQAKIIAHPQVPYWDRA